MPETDLERAVSVDPVLQEGLAWGKPRRGHPEGSVGAHVSELLQTIDRWGETGKRREELRFLGLVHDALKNKVQNRRPKTGENHHAMRARRFAERYINDERLLATIEQHDRPYNLWRRLTRSGRVDDHAVSEMLDRIPDLELFLRFVELDGSTEGQEPGADPLAEEQARPPGSVRARPLRAPHEPTALTADLRARGRGCPDGPERGRARCLQCCRSYRFARRPGRAAGPPLGRPCARDCEPPRRWPDGGRPRRLWPACVAPWVACVQLSRPWAWRRASSAAWPRGSRPASSRSPHPRRCGGPQRAVRLRLRLPAAVPGQEHRPGRSRRRVWPPPPGGTRPGWRTRRRGRARCRSAL